MRDKQQAERRDQKDKKTEEVKGYIKGLTNLKDYIAEKLVKHAEELGKLLAAGREKEISKRQIRLIFSAIKKMELRGFDRGRLLLLKPKLAYLYGKNRKLKQFKEIITICIDKVKDEDDFKKLVDFVEAILAYHKAYDNTYEEKNNGSEESVKPQR